MSGHSHVESALDCLDWHLVMGGGGGGGGEVMGEGAKRCVYRGRKEEWLNRRVESYKPTVLAEQQHSMV